ncbi:coiled-coil domain-containing protein 186-like isoform X2 [Dreissena polymorpha]|uniref:coiled-coil domain-containing protein 186-like isoform X2 n=1 Tax=Dreissena polymorpha TaxID=45954 RepID=UPI00226401F4|nr:coiled-coil domain-containing protein 186-like isoform X2 [Dreissena polymorpha]
MSDVESESGERENPNPESECNEEQLDELNAAETESDEADLHLNDTDQPQKASDPNGCNEGTSERSNECKILHNELNKCQPLRNEEEGVYENYDRNDAYAEEIAGSLAEGDQDEVGREDDGIIEDFNVNYAAEDEQYLAGADCSLEPESNSVLLTHHDDGAAVGSSECEPVSGRIRQTREHERTESSAQIELRVSQFGAGPSRVEGGDNVGDERTVFYGSDGASASGIGEFLMPESEIGECFDNTGANEEQIENDPTESDQENEGAVSNEVNLTNVVPIIMNSDTDNVETGASEMFNEFEQSDHVEQNFAVSGSNSVIQTSFPEDETNAVTAQENNAATAHQNISESDLHQPECDQSESNACGVQSSDQSESDTCGVQSSRNTVEALNYYSADNLKSVEGKIVQEELNGESYECSKSCVPERESKNYAHHSKDLGAIPKTKQSRGMDNSMQQSTIKESVSDKTVDSEDELLSELDATLKDASNVTIRNAESHILVSSDCHSELSAISNVEHGNEKSQNIHSCDQCLKNNVWCSFSDRVGLKGETPHVTGIKELKGQLKQAKQLLMDRECEISRLKSDMVDNKSRWDTLTLERDSQRKELEHLKRHNADDLYLPQIKELEYTIASQQSELKSMKETLSSHDQSAKRAISTLQMEMKARVDQVTQQLEEANREKDSMVVKFAQAEHKNLECVKRADRAESKLRDMDRERTQFLEKMRIVKEQKSKLATELEAKNAELSKLKDEMDKQRELVASADNRVKWAQNKLKAELESHKETKTQLDKMAAKVKEAKEETQQIRRDCQAIIKQYQESEEVKSNSLDKELKQKESELLENQVQKTNFELAHVKTQRELEQMRGELKDTQKSLTSLKERFSTVDGEKQQATSTVSQYGEIIQKQKKEIQELRDRVESLVHYKTDFARAQEMIKSLDSEISELKISNKELVSDMDACRRRESDRLELTAKLSRKNAELQSENSTLSNKVMNLTGELQVLKMDSQDVDTRLKELEENLCKERKQREEEAQSFTSRLAGKTQAVEDLTRKLEDERDEMKTLKRKHANNVKDLTRQLQQVRRKLDNYEVTSNGDRDTVSLGSRTSSNGSLNTVGIAEQTHAHVVQPSHAPAPAAQRHPSPEQEYRVITEQVEVDKQTLIERIVKLQGGMARKNEKIEFMEDHISQLIDEIQKKNKILQSYILKEESGTMTSDFRDRTKIVDFLIKHDPELAEISRKHSIMGSVYSSHSNDVTMTLDLSLEINRKLQAVLEDTILKNMTLKESLDTLGQEIARLSQENRSLQLQIQGTGKSRSRIQPANR